MRKLAVLAIAVLPVVAAAQGGGARVGPQFVSYSLAAPSSVTISEMAIPIFVYVPVSRGLTLDIGTSYATANVKSTGTGPVRESKISGLTDTQIRATMNLGSDFVLVTAGLNLPTGRTTADTSEQEAASLIGNDFLVFPISSMGSGLGGTGGLALARPMGLWNLGAGLSVRSSMPFDPYEDATGNKLRYTPGTEMRARIGLDHPYGTGSASIGVTYSKFADDKFESSIYNTGDRLLTQGYVSNSAMGGDYVVSAWNMFRSAGTLADGSTTGTEMISDLSLAYGRMMGGGRVEPGLNFRTWNQQGADMSLQASLSMRYEKALGRMVVVPMVGFTTGSISAPGVAASALTGFRGQLTIRMQ